MMKKRTQPRQTASKRSALESLRERGMRADDFVEGYSARDAIMHAGQMVRSMRKDAGLTQTQLAERANMSQAEISRLEAGLGKQGPSVETLNRLAQACDLRLVMAMQEIVASTEEGESAELKYLAEM